MENGTQIAGDELLVLCVTIPPELRLIADADFMNKPSADKWSKKEILGHLIDSAAANHQRFVRGQLEDCPVIFYEQDLSVAVQNYQEENASDLINLWEAYNRHLAHVVQHIPSDRLANECVYKDGTKACLSFLVHDYLLHLKHHLDQILS